ncbi:hypothetical protein CLPUN_50190 [Clostridium puniceum]|uniref:Uncharacterized protein n=1 Tax=Clostridium puniceum TaxID=29367 RepID=A0A1S8SZR9_9CLOT|nr:hypothetical protein [Clostridium puniceum]OOM71027.1 hypothetical protein CLPUN_50190 [Clostridium puniceum]
MFNILQYVAIVAAVIGVVYLFLFCASIIGGKKEKILKNLFRSLIFIGIFAIYVVVAVKFQLPFF